MQRSWLVILAAALCLSGTAAADETLSNPFGGPRPTTLKGITVDDLLDLETPPDEAEPHPDLQQPTPGHLAAHLAGGNGLLVSAGLHATVTAAEDGVVYYAGPMETCEVTRGDAPHPCSDYFLYGPHEAGADTEMVVVVHHDRAVLYGNLHNLAVGSGDDVKVGAALGQLGGIRDSLPGKLLFDVRPLHALTRSIDPQTLLAAPYAR